MKNNGKKNSFIDKNMIDVIELKLKELEKEKKEIESLYGIDENILEEFTKKNILSESLKSNVTQPKTKLKNLPKLEVNKKEKIHTSYKTPDSLQDSLKYEPSIKDLLIESEFEPSFKNINSLKTYPSIIQGFDVSEYVNYINVDFNNTYIH